MIMVSAPVGICGSETLLLRTCAARNLYCSDEGVVSGSVEKRTMYYLQNLLYCNGVVKQTNEGAFADS